MPITPSHKTRYFGTSQHSMNIGAAA